MLELKATGDTHPRTFTLTTDDSEAELSLMADVLEEWAGDFDTWFQGTTAEQFAAGVVVPAEFVVDGGLGELMGGCGFDQPIEEFERVRREHMDEIEAKMEAGE
ncbi:MAG: hypothetical protein M3Y33_17800 [Actinomycetota bacterium]|nr:hypothetical protein [Actinomycetota bacterium]